MQQGRKSPGRLRGVVITCVVIIAAVAVAAAITLSKRPDSGPLPVNLPATPGSYLGVYATGSPASYSGVTSFKNATGTHPDVLMYYSGWFEPFQVSFAQKAAKRGRGPARAAGSDGPEEGRASAWPRSRPGSTTRT